MKSQKSIPYDMKISMIRIHTYENKNPTGTIYNPYFEGNAEFNSLTEMLVLIEGLLDEIACPQPYMERRRFLNKYEEVKQNVKIQLHENLESIATFQLKVLFRQNASWQGSLKWMDGDVEVQFRSVLEMVRLMDDVITETIQQKEAASA